VRFCPNCSNLLIPKNKKLYCKACEEFFDLEQQEDYRIIKKIVHDEKESAPIIIKESFKGEKISQSDRKAFEEYFGSSEADSY
jgi:DNA-directed RNA polymerase subunit M/transcription elongation factor TFIIS